LPRIFAALGVVGAEEGAARTLEGKRCTGIGEGYEGCLMIEGVHWQGNKNFKLATVEQTYCDRQLSRNL